MKLIVGLGNPGRDYTGTRHNAGWMVVDRLVDRHAPGQPVRARFHSDTHETPIGSEKCLLLKPTTYMNRSGIAVAEAARFFKLDPEADVLVITDDIALPVGAIRLRPKGGAGGHNGLKDIQQRLGTDVYARLRFGVGQPHPGEDQSSYVLGRFAEAERVDVDRAIGSASDAVEAWVNDGMDAAMNKFNVAGAGAGASKWGKPGEASSDKAQPETGIDPGWLGG
ncbi:MAG: aminoacyl-tRNA hydrolase [Planctomycetota bacterium]